MQQYMLQLEERSGLNQALVNAGQAISMLQIADGAMSYVNDVLIRMKSLAVQAGSGSLSGTERSMINTEYQALLSEVDRIASDTEFAGTTLVNGSIAVTTGSATDYAASQGVQDITFVGNHSTASNPNRDLLRQERHRIDDLKDQPNGQRPTIDQRWKRDHICVIWDIFVYHRYLPAIRVVRGLGRPCGLIHSCCRLIGVIHTPPPQRKEKE